MTVEDLIVPFSQIYGPGAIYVHQIERLGEEDDRKTARCFYKVSSVHANRSSDLPALDRFEPAPYGKYVGILDVTPGHAIDHFIRTPILPGHKLIRAAAAFLANRLDATHVEIFDLESADFKRIVVPGDQLTIFQPQAQVIEIRKRQEVAAVITGLRIKSARLRSFRDPLLPDQLIEAMVQSAAATALDLKKGLDGIPVFQAVGRTRFNNWVFEGSEVEMITKTRPQGRGFIGDVEAFVHGEAIAMSENMRAMIIPKKIAARVVGIKL